MMWEGREAKWEDREALAEAWRAAMAAGDKKKAKEIDAISKKVWRNRFKQMGAK